MYGGLKNWVARDVTFFDGGESVVTETKRWSQQEIQVVPPSRQLQVFYPRVNPSNLMLPIHVIGFFCSCNNFKCWLSYDTFTSKSIQLRFHHVSYFLIRLLFLGHNQVTVFHYQNSTSRTSACSYLPDLWFQDKHSNLRKPQGHQRVFKISAALYQTN